MTRLLLLIVIGLLSTAHANPYYYTGKEVEICHKPDTITHLSHVRGAPYFLNYGEAWPKSYLTIVIWERDASRLEINPYQYFKGELFCMKGRVTTYNNSPQLIIRNHNQLTVQPVN